MKIALGCCIVIRYVVIYFCVIFNIFCDSGNYMIFHQFNIIFCIRQIEEGVTGAEPTISLGRWREHQLNPNTTDKAAIDWYVCYNTSLLLTFKYRSLKLVEYWLHDCFAARAGVKSKWVGIDQFNSNSIPELERELELKDLEQNDLNWNWKILNGIRIGIDRFGIDRFGIE